MKNRTLPAWFAVAVLGVATPALAQTILTPYAFTTFAGDSGGAGNTDGVGTSARFNNPMGVALDSATNIYIADEFNDTIRKITRAGTNWIVTTLAGSARLYGTTDATNSFARFSQPTGVAADGAGNIYVADQSNFTLRKVTPAGVVTTLAGLAGSSGSKDGSNGVARFNRPAGVAVDSTGTKIYVADAGNVTIRQVVPIGTNWVVTTIAGTAGQSGNYDGTNGTIRFGNTVLGPQSLALDNDGNLIVADIWNSTIRKLTQSGTNWIASTLAGTGSIGTQDGTNTAAGFYDPFGVALDPSGTIYVNDGNGHVRKMTPVGTNWVVTTLVHGSLLGSSDGLDTAASFGSLNGIAVDGAGNMYVADANYSTIRMITQVGTNGLVTTIAGTATHFGTNDGVGTAARFYSPFGVATDTASNLYIGDQSANLIRKITPDGTVTTLVGDSFGGNFDSTNANATVRQPSCLALDGAGNIYFADAGNYEVRRVSPVGTNWAVKTLAGGGGPGGPGSKDGTNKNSSFSFFFGLCVDAATNIYVADTGNNVIRKVSPQGTNWVVTTIAGTAGVIGGNDGTNKTAQFYMPYGITVDSATNLYVADWDNQTIRKISPSGTNWITTTIAGLAGFFGSVDGTNKDARFLYPQGITIDPAGNLYVSDGGNCAIRRLSPQGTNWVVTTLGGAARADVAGGVGQAGSSSGIGSAARLNNVYGLAVGPDGNLYIPDAGENIIIKANPLFLFDTAATTYAASSNSVQMRVTGPPGSNLVLQVSSNLANWSPVVTNAIPPIGANMSIPATNGTGIFRAILMP